MNAAAAATWTQQQQQVNAAAASERSSSSNMNAAAAATWTQQQQVNAAAAAGSWTQQQEHFHRHCKRSVMCRTLHNKKVTFISPSLFNRHTRSMSDTTDKRTYSGNLALHGCCPWSWFVCVNSCNKATTLTHEAKYRPAGPRKQQSHIRNYTHG